MLNIAARHALEEVFARFTAEQISEFEERLNSSKGKELMAAIATDSARKSERTSSRVPFWLQGSDTSQKMHLDVDKFADLFAAAARMDPIRATQTIMHLGYRPNFTPLEKGDAAPKQVRARSRSSRSKGKLPKIRTVQHSQSQPIRRQRPASAGHARARRPRTQRSGRPSTAGRARSGATTSRNVQPMTSSFHLTNITPRHASGPASLFWRWLHTAPSAEEVKRRKARSRATRRPSSSRRRR